MPDQFTAQVGAWAAKTKTRMEAVFKQSAQDVAEEMRRPRGAGGRMPVDTGFLRASLQASTAAMPAIDKGARPAEGQSYMNGASPIALVIASAKLGQTIHLGFVAAYAAHVEFGARGRTPTGFVRGAADQWPQIVSRNAAELKRRSG